MFYGLFLVWVWENREGKAAAAHEGGTQRQAWGCSSLGVVKPRNSDQDLNQPGPLTFHRQSVAHL